MFSFYKRWAFSSFQICKDRFWRDSFVRPSGVFRTVSCLSLWRYSSFDWRLKRRLDSFSRSVQIAGVELEGGHLHPVAKPLDLSPLEEVILVVLDDDPLQLVDLALHPGTQLSLHLQQGLQTEAARVGAFQQERGFFQQSAVLWCCANKCKFHLGESE